MSKRSVPILVTVFGVIGISEAFGGKQCAQVKYGYCAEVDYGIGKPRLLEVWQEPKEDRRPNNPKTLLGVRKIKRLDPQQATPPQQPEPPDFCYVKTIRTHTGGKPKTGWISDSKVGSPTRNCSSILHAHRYLYHPSPKSRHRQ